MDTEDLIDLEGIKKVHFIGIGGSGMFPLVQIFKKMGFEVSGSDNNESDIVRMARKMGIDVSMKQVAENITDQDLIIYTSAILEDNAEFIAAKKSGIKLVERNDVLGYLTRQYRNCICISGTHGKTTTTALVSQILLDSQKDPTFVIGGKLSSTGSYSRLGSSDVMVCEACEFKDHFLKLAPTVSVILNIDNDHMDYFKTIENAKKSYARFCDNTESCIIYNGDDGNVLDVINSLDRAGKEFISFGFGEKNDYHVEDIERLSGLRTKFSIYRGKELVGNSFEIKLLGHHNFLNALAAYIASTRVLERNCGIEKGFKNFSGVGRRFEFVGEKNGVTIVDDYAHHPSEIEATLKAAKTCGFKKIWIIHQPFTYSRTKMLLAEFAKALSFADEVVLTDILGSREKNVFSVSSKDLAEKIDGCSCFKTQEEAAAFVLKKAKPGELVITAGCGDIYKAAKIMVFGRY